MENLRQLYQKLINNFLHVNKLIIFIDANNTYAFDLINSLKLYNYQNFFTFKYSCFNNVYFNFLQINIFEKYIEKLFFRLALVS